MQRVEERNARIKDIIPSPSTSSTVLLSLDGSTTEDLRADVTEVLNRSDPVVIKGIVQQEVDESHGMFRLEKYEIYIHTNEVV